mgnify:CR=1 FL=1
MPRVVAFEGNPGATDGVTWGAAAIDDGARIVNSVTRFEVSHSELATLVEQGTLVVLPTPVDLSPSDASGGVLVARVSKTAPRYADLQRLRRGALVQSESPEAQHYIHANKESLTAAACDVIDALVEAALYEHWGTAFAGELVRVGLTLDSSNPSLNALWAYQNRHRAFVENVARSNVERGNGRREMTGVRRGGPPFQGEPPSPSSLQPAQESSAS